MNTVRGRRGIHGGAGLDADQAEVTNAARFGGVAEVEDLENAR